MSETSEKPKINMVENATPAATHSVSSRHKLNAPLVWATIWASLGSLTYGYTAAIIGYILIQPHFIETLNIASKPGMIGFLVSIYSVGGIVGIWTGSWVGNKYGRKSLFLWSSMWGLVGIALFAGCQNLPMALVGRFCLGFAGHSGLMAHEIYVMEIAPASIRGMLGITAGVVLETGFIFGGWVGFLFFLDKQVIAWRIPLILQLVPVLGTLIGYKWAPESPRWLVTQGREDEALAVLKKLHHTKDDAEDIFALSEHYQITQQYNLDKTLPSSWISMFTKYWRRTAVSVFVMTGYIGNGANFLGAYGPTLYASLGFSTNKSLLYQAGWTSMYIFNIVMFPLIDRFGRRFFLLFGLGGDLVIMIIECVLASQFGGSNTPNGAPGKSAVVSMIFVFSVFTMAAEPPAYLYSCELHPMHVRTKGVAVAYTTLAVMNIWINEAGPAAIETIGYKFFIVFICLIAFHLILYWFWLPETSNVPLEEMAKLFGDEKDVAIFQEDIHLDSTTQKVYGGHDADHT